MVHRNIMESNQTELRFERISNRHKTSYEDFSTEFRRAIILCASSPAVYNPGHKIVAKCTISAKKTCFPSTRKVLDFDLNGQHMRKTEVPEGDWVLGCSPDHSTIRPKILSLKSQPSPKDLLLDERS